MRLKQKNIKRNLLPGVLLLATAVVLVILPLATMVKAAQYHVWGRVYSASPLDEDEECPANPLTGVPAEQIIGNDMYAQIPRNLVKVRVIKENGSQELGSYIVTQDGGYLISFNIPETTIAAKFIIEELATSKVLFESEAEELLEWKPPVNPPNIRYILLPESLTEIGDGREFAICPVPGKYTAIFTRVGKIEVATEVGGVTLPQIEPTTGLVNVVTSVAGELHIPPYQDAPLGGNLFIFGAFSSGLYKPGPGRYYRIRVDNLDTSTTTYMDDSLVKTKYTVNLLASPPTVTTERVALGPATIGGTPNCYELTPLSVGNEFWSFPDLLALWRTGGLNGNYRLTLEIVGIPPTDFIPVPDYTGLRVHLDNLSPLARILPLYSGAGDTPRIYTPGPAVPSPDDLLNSMLGAPADYGSIPNPICSILEYTNPDHHLAFKLNAHHSNGFMRYWHFKFKRNDGNYQTVIGKKYNGTTNLMEDYSGVKIPLSGYTSDQGFQDKYLYLNNTQVDLGSPDGCAYRFVIRAATRATDGYHYLRWSGDEDLHYLKK